MPVILHIDMNSYFASVEQQANPFLRGRAVGVCAYLSPHGCILASSKEAKQHGVKTGMRVQDAKLLHPPTIFLENDPPKYRSITQAVFNILAEYTDRIEPYSIDEAFLDLTGHVHNLEDGLHIGQMINQRIKHEVGEWLGSSVGIAETRFLAKLASDTGAKDSVTPLPSALVPHYLARLHLEDVWGIAGATRRHLEALGIKTPLELRNADPMRILSVLGKYGYHLWASLNGHEAGETAPTREEAKSIGHSYCLPKKTKDKSFLAAILMKLSEKTGRRLRDKAIEAHGLSVSWGYANGGGGGLQRRLALPLWDSWDIFSAAYRPLAEASLADRVSFLAIGVTNFSSPSPQSSLFLKDNETKQKKRALTAALDTLNDRWGEYTVTRGAMFGTGDHAPDRIGYRKSLHAPMLPATAIRVDPE